MILLLPFPVIICPSSLPPKSVSPFEVLCSATFVKPQYSDAWFLLGSPSLVQLLSTVTYALNVELRCPHSVCQRVTGGDYGRGEQDELFSFHVYLNQICFWFCLESQLIWKSEKLIWYSWQFKCKFNYDSFLSVIDLPDKAFLCCLISDFRKSLQTQCWPSGQEGSSAQGLSLTKCPLCMNPEHGTNVTFWQGPRGKSPVSQFHIYTFSQRMLWPGELLFV